MGYNIIMVVVDWLSSKYVYFLLLNHMFIVSSMVALFVKEIVGPHGYHHNIVSNGDKIFDSIFWEELFRPLGTQLRCSSTAYQRQTNV